MDQTPRNQNLSAPKSAIFHHSLEYQQEFRDGNRFFILVADKIAVCRASWGLTNRIGLDKTGVEWDLAIGVTSRLSSKPGAYGAWVTMEETQRPQLVHMDVLCDAHFAGMMVRNAQSKGCLVFPCFLL